MSVWPGYTVGRAWLIVRDVNFICHMQIGVSFTWVQVEWILGERWRGKVREGRQERFQPTESKRQKVNVELHLTPASSGTQLSTSRFSSLKRKKPQLIQATVSTFLNSTFPLGSGMSARLPFCDWSTCGFTCASTVWGKVICWSNTYLGCDFIIFSPRARG